MLSGLPAVFAVASATASTLQFGTQPGNGTADAAIPTFVVNALDSYGNVATTFNSPVSLTLAGAATSVSLSGTVTATPVSGVATWRSTIASARRVASAPAKRPSRAPWRSRAMSPSIAWGIARSRAR